MKEDKKKIYLRSFGCQMNERDSEVIKGLLLAEGYKLTEEAKGADIVLLNTCSVRQHAEDKVWSELGRYGKRGSKKPIIGIIGCMAQSYKEEVFKRAPSVDIVCGPSSIDNIALYLEEALRKKNVLAVEEKKRREEIYHTGFYEERGHAYVVISEGCDNYCSYCVVPYARGRLRHRSSEDILAEVKEALDSDIGNITLLGQNVNSYEDASQKIDFTGLLKKVSSLEGLKSLSFITSHPKDTSPALFKLMAQTPVIKRYFHLPVQSGSDRILKAMNRGYTAKKYLEIVDQYRSIVYNGQLSTDIIVGFPSETEEDFAQTLDLARRVGFDSAYIFKYSPRPNTKAALLSDDVPMEAKKRRHAQLLKLQKEISNAKKK